MRVMASESIESVSTILCTASFPAGDEHLSKKVEKANTMLQMARWVLELGPELERCFPFPIISQQEPASFLLEHLPAEVQMQIKKAFYNDLYDAALKLVQSLDGGGANAEYWLICNQAPIDYTFPAECLPGLPAIHTLESVAAVAVGDGLEPHSYNDFLAELENYLDFPKESLRQLLQQRDRMQHDINKLHQHITELRTASSQDNEGVSTLLLEGERLLSESQDYLKSIQNALAKNFEKLNQEYYLQYEEKYTQPKMQADTALCNILDSQPAQAFLSVYKRRSERVSLLRQLEEYLVPVVDAQEKQHAAALKLIRCQGAFTTLSAYETVVLMMTLRKILQSKQRNLSEHQAEVLKKIISHIVDMLFNHVMSHHFLEAEDLFKSVPATLVSSRALTVGNVAAQPQFASAAADAACSDLTLCSSRAHNVAFTLHSTVLVSTAMHEHLLCHLARGVGARELVEEVEQDDKSLYALLPPENQCEFETQSVDVGATLEWVVIKLLFDSDLFRYDEFKLRKQELGQRLKEIEGRYSQGVTDIVLSMLASCQLVVDQIIAIISTSRDLLSLNPQAWSWLVLSCAQGVAYGAGAIAAGGERVFKATIEFGVGFLAKDLATIVPGTPADFGQRVMCALQQGFANGSEDVQAVGRVPEQQQIRRYLENRESTAKEVFADSQINFAQLNREITAYYTGNPMGIFGNANRLIKNLKKKNIDFVKYKISLCISLEELQALFKSFQTYLGPECDQLVLPSVVASSSSVEERIVHSFVRMERDPNWRDQQYGQTDSYGKCVTAFKERALHLALEKKEQAPLAPQDKVILAEIFEAKRSRRDPLFGEIGDGWWKKLGERPVRDRPGFSD